MVAQLTTEQWITLLYGEADGWLSILAADDGPPRAHWAQTPEQAAELLERYGRVGDVWLGCSTRAEKLDKGRGGDADCLEVPGLWLDIDVAGDHHKKTNLPADKAQARELLAEFPLQPTAIIDSGGGYQAWWLFPEPLPAADVGITILPAWAHTWKTFGERHGWHVDNVFDVARVMRVPGTLNHKSTPPKPVTIVHLVADRRYNLDDLDGYTIEPPVLVPEPRETRDSDSIRAGDRFNAVTQLGGLLLDAGCVYDHADRDGTEHYRAPHHAHDRTTGIVVYPADARGDEHVTVFSETFAAQHSLEPRRPYDAFGLFTHLSHGGDFARAREALAGPWVDVPADVMDLVTPGSVLPETPGLPAAGKEASSLFKLGEPLDWPEAFSADEDTENRWLIEPLIALGRAHALYAGAKTGKSLLILAASAALASGRAFLDMPEHEPVPVLYADYEMTRDDVVERLRDFGYAPEDLTNLHYFLLGSGNGLDTEEGGRDLVHDALLLGVGLVVVDTTARAVAGAENEADTLRAFYRCTGAPLKRRDISVVRLDHAGKDATKGQRGTSAKNDDVDVVWKLSAVEFDEDSRPVKFDLEATHQRMGWVERKVGLNFTEEVTTGTYEWQRRNLGEKVYKPQAKEIADLLDALEAPAGMTVDDAMELLRSVGQGKRKDRVVSALQWRVDAANPYLNTTPRRVDNTLESRDPHAVDLPVDDPAKRAEPAAEPSALELLGNRFGTMREL